MAKHLPESFNVFLQIAYSDYKAAKALFEAGDSDFYEKILFFCQQSVEKFLKAYLMKLDKDFPRTHDLEELFELIPNESFKKYYFLANVLNEHAVVLRYEEGDILEKELVSETLESVRQFIVFMEDQLK
jgi:HEPN domain-containing protein